MYEYFSIYQQKTALKPLLIPKPHTILKKFSKCQDKAAWHGNFTIILQLKFYVKSNFGELKRSKILFLAISEGQNFNFGKFMQFFNAQND